MSFHLEEYGLSKNEAAVYAAALELGPATADQLAKHSGVKRSTTYLQIEALQEKGLMSSHEEGKKTLFTPESPENLTRLLERQRAEIDLRQKELNKELPELIRSFESAGERPVVRFYQGKEGIITMRENALQQLSKGDVLQVMYSYDLLFKLFDASEIAPFSEKREKQGIQLDIIYTRESGPLDISTRGVNSNRAFISPKKFPLHADLFIYKNTLAIMALQGNIFGIEVTSKAIAESHKNIFKLIWQIAEAE